MKKNTKRTPICWARTLDVPYVRYYCFGYLAILSMLANLAISNDSQKILKNT